METDEKKVDETLKKDPEDNNSPTEKRKAEILLEIKKLTEILLFSQSLQVCKKVDIENNIRFFIVEYNTIEKLSENIPKEKTPPT